MASDSQTRASHNSLVRSSGNLGRIEGSSHLVLAAQVARSVGMVESWPNVQVIRLAIEAETEFSQVSPGEAALVIIEAAREATRPPVFSPPSPFESREIARLNQVDRFWFEDARWRMKIAYLEFLRRRDGEAAEVDGKCQKHPQSGPTEWGTCWACYAESYGYKIEAPGPSKAEKRRDHNLRVNAQVKRKLRQCTGDE